MSFFTSCAVPEAAPDPATKTVAPPAAQQVWLSAGATLFQRGGLEGVWRLASGFIRLDQRGQDTSVLVSVALPGDLVGYETLLGQPHLFDATALAPACLQPLTPQTEAERHALMVEALLLQPQRSHDMARMRTGPVLARVGEMLRLLGFMPSPGLGKPVAVDADALRASLPPLRELAELVDAKPETVCRALAQLLPPRTRKSGPKPRSRLAVGAPLGPGALQGAW